MYQRTCCVQWRLQQSSTKAVGVVRITIKVPRSHTIRHTKPAGLLWMSDQVVLDAATYTALYKHMVDQSSPQRDSNSRSLQRSRRCLIRNAEFWYYEINNNTVDCHGTSVRGWNGGPVNYKNCLIPKEAISKKRCTFKPIYVVSRSKVWVCDR